VLLDAGASTSTTDKNGTYLFRNVTPGPHVVTTEISGTQVRHEVEIDSAPGALRDIDLEVQGTASLANAGPVEHTLLRPGASSLVAPAATAGVAPQKGTTSAHWSNGFAVQIGAFREKENVRKAVRDAEGAGLPHYITEQGALVIVRVGPFASRAEADEARRRLSRSNVEGFVVSTRSKERSAALSNAPNTDP
jgi:cell division septation protein DedD